MILGIDPGKNGALVWVDNQKISAFSDMPQTIDEIAEMILLYSPDTRFAVIEDVSAMTYTATDQFGNKFKRGQGASASFTFGFGTGILHGVLAALKIRAWPVKPATWKMTFGLTANKSDSLKLATKLFPESAQLFSRKKDDGRAEAALIALFGSTRFK